MNTGPGAIFIQNLRENCSELKLKYTELENFGTE